MQRIIVFALACLTLAACGGQKLSGTYAAKDGGLIMQKVEFLSGDEVNITMLTQTIRGTYKIDGDQLLLIVNGQQQVFKIDGSGCLDGGLDFGKLCKA